MKVIVTATDSHKDIDGSLGFSDQSTPFTGQHLRVSADGVWVDQVQVIWRDRRAKKNRMDGHPWITDRAGEHVEWTSFRVEVKP